jgi:hypothetical protein
MCYERSAGVSTLLGRHSLDLLGAVLLIVRLAPITVETSVHLSTNTRSISNFELLDILPYVGDFPDNLVSGANPVSGQRTPTT